MDINLSKTVSFEKNNLGKTKILGTISNTSKEIKERIRKVNTIAIKNHKYLTSQKIKLKNRIRIHITYIRPKLLYNCSTWTTAEEDFKRREAFERKGLRKVFGAFYPNRIENEELMKQSNLEEIRGIFEKRRWSYLLHILKKTKLSMLTELDNALKKHDNRHQNDLNKKELSNFKSQKPGLEHRRLGKHNICCKI